MSGQHGTTVLFHARDGVPTCTYCRGDCAPAVSSGSDDASVVCQGCQAHYHPDCLAELGACATLGCPQPRASRTRRVVVVQAPRCCRGDASGGASTGRSTGRSTDRSTGRVMLCDACGGRWHDECLARRRIDACCPGHGFSPEQGLGRARDRGPRVGSRRGCAACAAIFTVQAASRYSPHCTTCRRRRNLVGLAFMALVLGGYVLMAVVGNLLPLLP